MTKKIQNFPHCELATLQLFLTNINSSPFFTFVEDGYVEVGRTFGISNVSLVITYVTIVVAALMLAGFLWMAFAYSGRNSGYDYRAKRDTFSNEEGNQFDFITFQYINYIQRNPNQNFPIGHLN